MVHKIVVTVIQFSLKFDRINGSQLGELSLYTEQTPVIPPYPIIQENVTQATQRVKVGRATVLNSTDAH